MDYEQLYLHGLQFVGYANPYTYTDRYSNAYANPNAYSHPNTYSYSDTHSHSDTNTCDWACGNAESNPGIDL